MLVPVCAAMAIVLASPVSGRAHHPGARSVAAARPTARSTELEQARRQLAQVKRDPVKRRLRHNWERAIAAIEKAARGRDRAPALLEAARARYALYRFSQVDSDRELALRLSMQARTAGAREAFDFAEAIRREMGSDEPLLAALAKARGSAATPRRELAPPA